MSIKLPTGKDTDYLLRQIKENRDKIINGTMLVIDPASVSMGYALYNKGKLVKSGKIKTPQKKKGLTIPPELRIKKLMEQLDFKPTDLLAIERLRGQMTPYSLYWSVGAVIVSHVYDNLIEIPIWTWKAFRDDEYFKDDRKDAETMGTTLIEIATNYREYQDL